MVVPDRPIDQLKRLREAISATIEVAAKAGFDVSTDDTEVARAEAATEDPVKMEDTIGIRELKNGLSHALKLVAEGMRFTITDRGQPVAMLGPVLPRPQDAWIFRMVAEGSAHWSGQRFERPPNMKEIKRRRARLKKMGDSKELARNLVRAVLEGRGRTPEEIEESPADRR